MWPNKTRAFERNLKHVAVGKLCPLRKTEAGERKEQTMNGETGMVIRT